MPDDLLHRIAEPIEFLEGREEIGRHADPLELVVLDGDNDDAMPRPEMAYQLTAVDPVPTRNPVCRVGSYT